MENTTPKISVVTSVYNCEKFIGETIESVINQTFRDWEFIIMDDCSKDRSPEIIQEYAAKDNRIKYFRNDPNKGQCGSLNYGMSLANGKYIARLDHDDICVPERFEKQYNFMEEHEECVLCGSWKLIWENGDVHKLPVEDYPLKDMKEVRLLSLEYDTLPHSSFFLRRSTMLEHDIKYREDYTYAEDYGMLADMLKYGEVCLLNDYLMIYRVFPEQVTQNTSREVIVGEADRARLDYLSAIDIKDKEIGEKYIRKELTTKEEFARFEEFIYNYAEFCGFGTDRDMIAKEERVRELFYKGCMDQKKTPVMLKAYANSKMKPAGWFFTKQGLSMALHCLLQKNTSFRG